MGYIDTAREMCVSRNGMIWRDLFHAFWIAIAKRLYVYVYTYYGAFVRSVHVCMCVLIKLFRNGTCGACEIDIMYYMFVVRYRKCCVYLSGKNLQS